MQKKYVVDKICNYVTNRGKWESESLTEEFIRSLRKDHLVAVYEMLLGASDYWLMRTYPKNINTDVRFATALRLVVEEINRRISEGITIRVSRGFSLNQKW